MHRSRAAFSALLAMILTSTLTGCAAMPSRYSFGVRPDIPVGPALPEVQEACRDKYGYDVTKKTKDKEIRERYLACLEFESVLKWSADLEEAYRTRATMNRWSIYLAGTIGLATVAASGGLAAASAVGLGTIALLSISGGFAAGFFAVVDNATLADIYTIAAGEIATARSNARKAVDEALGAKPTVVKHDEVVSAFYTKAGELRAKVASARNMLESSRTSSAAHAIQRTQEQIAQLKSDIDQLRTARSTQVVVESQIIAIQDVARTPAPALPGGSETEWFLIVKDINLEGFRKEDLTVDLGGQNIKVAGIGPDPTKPANANIWMVRFSAPGTPPVAGQKSYSPILIVDGKTDGKRKVTSTVNLTYQ